MSDLAMLQSRIDRDEARLKEQPAWPGGWPNEIEAALIDAVFSIRARYGSENSGVRAVVERWRKERAAAKVDDLNEIVNRTDEELARVFGNDSKTGGQAKSGAVREAATALLAVGVARADDVTFDSRREVIAAYTSVRGLGPVTASYFTMLLGVPGIKADVHICRYVTDALSEDPLVSPERAYDLLHGVNRPFPSTTHLDHAIWQLQRRHGS